MEITLLRSRQANASHPAAAGFLRLFPARLLFRAYWRNSWRLRVLLELAGFRKYAVYYIRGEFYFE